MNQSLKLCHHYESICKMEKDSSRVDSFFKVHVQSVYNTHNSKACTLFHQHWKVTKQVRRWALTHLLLLLWWVSTRLWGSLEATGYHFHKPGSKSEVTFRLLLEAWGSLLRLVEAQCGLPIASRGLQIGVNQTQGRCEVPTQDPLDIRLRPTKWVTIYSLWNPVIIDAVLWTDNEARQNALKVSRIHGTKCPSLPRLPECPNTIGIYRSNGVLLGWGS